MGVSLSFSALAWRCPPSPRPPVPSGSASTAAASQADRGSDEPAISANGRFVAFSSTASNLVAGDTNNFEDIFVHDRRTGATELVSVALGAAGVDGTSVSSAISADGRYVAFVSDATNLVAGDTNGQSDIFVHDRRTGATERVSVDSSGVQADRGSDEPAISANGRFVAFSSTASNLVADDTNGQRDIFVHDRRTGAGDRVSVDTSGAQGNDGSYGPAISANGRFVAFRSLASNLVADDTNGQSDIFVHDRRTGATERVSVDSSGIQANNRVSDLLPAISADGRYVAFGSQASNLVAGDTNDREDIFVHDRRTGATERVSVDSSGVQADGNSNEPAISADGRYVAFVSDATNLVDAAAHSTQSRLI